MLALNGYPESFVAEMKRKSRRSTSEASQPAQDDSRWVSLPYFHGVSQAVSRILEPLGIRVAHRADSWQWKLCCGIKDQVAPRKKKGIVYSVPCAECPKEYIGESCRNLEVRLKEHDRCVRQGDQMQSAVAEHVCVQGHNIDWDGTKVIDRVSERMERHVKEAVNIASRSSERLMKEDCGMKICGQWKGLVR